MPIDLIYDRQQQLALTMPDVVTVVGCGGTGFWTGLFLAMSGVKELILVDDDTIQHSNLNRLPLPMQWVTGYKVRSLRDFIKNLRPETRIETHLFKITKPEDCLVLRGVVFCCTDNLKSQQIVCAYCKKNNIKYQRVGYDGTTLNVSRGFPLTFDNNAPDGYQVTPSWVVPAALAAALGVSSIMYEEICIMDDISKLHILDSSYVPEGIRDGLIDEGEENIKESGDWGYCSDCNRSDWRTATG
jgi:hypothetical protein